MIQRFSFGHPIPTESGGGIVFSVLGLLFLRPIAVLLGAQGAMLEDCVVYGLGEMPRGLNKRGWHYVTNNTDESRHTEDKLSYYGAHNFLLIRNGAECFGLFVDFPGKVHYDIG